MMVAMACETRHCRLGRRHHPVSTRRQLRCRQSPANGPSRFYLVGRYYDPKTGQFLSVDPLVQETQQAYLYAGDNPENERSTRTLRGDQL